MRRLLSAFLALAFTAFAAASWAADDPTIKEPLRGQIQDAMRSFVEDRTIDGVMRQYDPATDEVLSLRGVNLHAGIVKKGDYFVSCADFTDGKGRKVDVDFLVLPDGSKVRAVQAIVHKVDGAKRPYDLEQ